MLFRRTAAFLLLLSFFAQAFSRYLSIADYYVNTSSYLVNCVNKDKPWMHCNGRCQLCKKLHQQDNTDDKQAPERRPGNNTGETLFAHPPLHNFTALQIMISSTRRFPELVAAEPIGMPRQLFHPPGAQLA
jgi:hypothetical protein